MLRYHYAKNDTISPRTTFSSERHLFLHRGNIPVNSGLVLSTDAKPRLKWTSELHERFIEAVNQLGGADKATPKTVMRLMGIPGLTLYHLKSHLQKYRLSKNLKAQANNGAPKIGSSIAMDRAPEVSGPQLANTSIGPQANKTMQISEAVQMQIEVQRQLNEQLEVQRHLQLRIEAQGKYLQSVLEKAQETLGKQNLGSAGLEAAKVQLSEIVSKVSNECLTSATGYKEIPSSLVQGTTTMPADCSIDSCLTSCDGPHVHQEMYKIGRELTYHGNILSEQLRGDTRLEWSQRAWCRSLRTGFSSNMVNELEKPMPTGKSDNNSPTPCAKAQPQAGGARSPDGWQSGHTSNWYLELNSTKTEVEQNVEPSYAYEPSCQGTQLDLNAYDNKDEATECKQFDLNGLSWN